MPTKRESRRPRFFIEETFDVPKARKPPKDDLTVIIEERLGKMDYVAVGLAKYFRDMIAALAAWR